MPDWLAWLMDPTPFTPRAACGPGWEPGLVAANQLGHALVAVAYLLIPMTLVSAAVSRRPLEPAVRWLGAAFAVFIFACGIGHVWDVAVFHWPAYRLFTAWVWLTAISSLAVAAALGPAAGQLLSRPTREDYEAETRRARRAEHAARDAENEATLGRRLAERKHEIAQKELSVALDALSRLEAVNGRQVEADAIRRAIEGVKSVI